MLNKVNNHAMQVRIRGDQFLQKDLNYYIEQDTQGIPVQHGKRQPKGPTLLIGLLVFLFVASSISSVVGYLIYHTYDERYQSDLLVAHAGVQHLQKADSLLASWSKSPLDTHLTNQAADEFGTATKTFNQLYSDLRSLPIMIKQIPTYGARLDSALRLIPLAITLSQDGVTGCNILNRLVSGMHDPLTSQGHGITAEDLSVVSHGVQELQSGLVSAAQQINQLQPVDLQFDVRIPKLIGTFHKDLPMLRSWLDTFQQLLPLAPTLLGIGTPTNYLIEVLDSTELRPGGGFIGNYGIATLSDGRLSAAHITDVDLIDKPYEMAGNTIPYPPSYRWFDLAPGSWSFRDSNLDADFPTAAQYGEKTYMKEGGNGPVQGVIAITPRLIEQALSITGPIAIPEYHETITSSNLIARIHFHQLGGRAAGAGSELIPSPDGNSSLRKRFTALLEEHFLAHVRQLSSADLSKLLLLMFNSVRSKDIQVYFNSTLAEKILQSYHLDSAIQSPLGDSLFVVDANIAANKANNFIINTLNDQVTIDSQGNAFHRASLQYTWKIPGKNYGNPVYRDFIHVYVPPGSILLMQNGWQPRGMGDAFNRKVWMGYFELSYGETHTITLEWKVTAAASKVQSSWRYQYLIQKQAGILWNLNLHIVLPTCATITNKRGRLLSNNEKEAILTQNLTEDVNLGVDYTCR
jgi:hypothetical protein